MGIVLDRVGGAALSCRTPSAVTMKFNKILFLLVILFAAYIYLRVHHHRVLARNAVLAMQTSANGFVSLPPPTNPPAGKVWVLAPPYCPSEAGQRADELMRLLPRAGISCVRTEGIDLNVSSQEEADRINPVMTAQWPIVVVYGRAKSNPTMDEIIAEYRQNVRH